MVAMLFPDTLARQVSYAVVFVLLLLGILDIQVVYINHSFSPQLLLVAVGYVLFSGLLITKTGKADHKIPFLLSLMTFNDLFPFCSSRFIFLSLLLPFLPSVSRGDYYVLGAACRHILRYTSIFDMALG
jgi:hypothetical protein